MPIEHLKLAHIPSKHVLKEFGACQSLQKEEIEVLESIYPEYISSRNSDGILNLEVPVELGSPRFVDITSSNRFDAHLIPHNQEEKISLTVLPPIRLHIVLPPSYPLYGPPKITSIRATHGWLPDTIALQTALIEMWQMQESVLYRWVEHVRSGDFLQDMEIVSANDQRTIQILHPNPSTLASLLSIYDTSSQSAQFSQNSYPCSICLTHLKGIKCLQLTCKHIFCRSCLEDFWQMCIAEGDVDRVGCPHPECIKEGKKVSEEDLAHVVSESEIQRWRRLTTKQKLERDPTMLNCPIPTCQALVPKPGDADPESGWDRFRQCSSCFFSFCSFCKYTWHGPLSPCPIAHTERLIQEYLATPEGSPERALIEARYGKGVVRRLVSRHEQEQATRTWISSSTTTCPGCESNIEKSEGCNHMTCTRCRNHFCYRCGQKLDATDPYKHFGINGTPCYNKLFEWVEEEE